MTIVTVWKPRGRMLKYFGTMKPAEVFAGWLLQVMKKLLRVTLNLELSDFIKVQFPFKKGTTAVFQFSWWIGIPNIQLEEKKKTLEKVRRSWTLKSATWMRFLNVRLGIFCHSVKRKFSFFQALKMLVYRNLLSSEKQWSKPWRVSVPLCVSKAWKSQKWLDCKNSSSLVSNIEYSMLYVSLTRALTQR